MRGVVRRVDIAEGGILCTSAIVHTFVFTAVRWRINGHIEDGRTMRDGWQMYVKKGGSEAAREVVAVTDF